MNKSYLENLLGEREEIILVTRQHWLVLAQHILPESLLGLAVIVAMTMLMARLPGPASALGFLLLIFPAITMVRDVLVWTNHVYVVTSRRVVQLMGVINKNVIDSSLEKVNDVKMEQSVWGRLFGYGDIEILTASELGINRFTRINNPIRFKTAMLNAKGRLEQEQARPAAAAADTGVPALIAQLEALRQAGVLSDEEFQKKKAELLARL
jgi:uncharacterized membrane protein YdbT with pleckstrin-like domain